MERPREGTTARFWLLAGLSLAGYLILQAWMPLAPHAAPTPRPDISNFTNWPWGVIAYSLLLAALFWLYWLAYRALLAARQALGLAAVLLPAVVFAVVLLGTFPVNALDVYNYLILGRVQAVFGQNPYLVAPNAIPQDPFLKYVGEWGGDTSPYGPVFQHAANAIALLARDNLLAGLLLFKFLAVLTFLGSAVLIWLLLTRSEPRERAAHTLLWAWNPALLLTFSMNAHNDGLMIFWLLLGLWLVQRRYPVAGFAIMALAPLTKLSGLLPIPFFLLAVLQSLPSLRSRVRLLLLAGISSVAVTLLVFLPFGSPLSMIERLVRTATGAGFSPLTLLLIALENLGVRVDVDTLVVVSTLIFALLALWLLWRTWQGRSAYQGAADVNAAYLLLSLGFRIWYAVWPFPWVVLDLKEEGGRRKEEGEKEERSPGVAKHPEAPAKWAEQSGGGRGKGEGGLERGEVGDARDRWVREFRLRAGVWFLITTQFSVLIYGKIRLELFGGSRDVAHLVGVLFTFGLPIVLAWIGARRYQR